MKGSLALPVTCLGLALSARAEETPTHQFDCDTPSGHYSQWKTSYVAEAARIRGTVKVLELRKEGQWTPGAHVYLYGTGETLIVGLILSVDDADQTKLQVAAIERGSRTLDQPFASVAWKDRVVSFEVVVAASGVIQLSVDGNSHDIEEPGFGLSAVGLRCTSGDFLFDAVSIGPGAR